MLLDQRVKDYLMSKGSNDWFIPKHNPSNDERSEFQKIVLENLLCKAGHYFFQACITDTIPLAYPTLSN